MNELVRNRIDNTLVDCQNFRNFWRMAYAVTVRFADALFDRDDATYNTYVMYETIARVCVKYKLDAGSPAHFPADYFPPDALKQLQDIRALRELQQEARELPAQAPRRKRPAAALFE